MTYCDEPATVYLDGDWPFYTPASTSVRAGSDPRDRRGRNQTAEPKRGRLGGPEPLAPRSCPGARGEV